MKLAFTFCVLICGLDANAAELPIPKKEIPSFTSTYTVKTAAEARTKLLQSKILAEKSLGSENLEYTSDFKPNGENITVTYKWKRK